MDWFTLSIVVACLLISAFFSASETALTGASRASMLRLSKQGNREADVVSSLFAMRERMIGALLLGNNIANIGASVLATGIFTAWFGEVGVLYATGVMTALVVIFAEVLPKTIAINAPDRVSLLVARPMKVMVYLLGPLLTVIEAVVRVLMKALGIKIGHNQPILSPTERLRGAVDLLHHEGKVEKQDRDMFGGLLDLRELEVSDVMVHRTEMVMINADMPAEEVLRVVLESPYRSLMEPLLEHIEQTQAANPEDYVTVILPEFLPARLWHHLLHNQKALLIKGALLFRRNVIVTSVPFHLAR